MKLLIKKGTTSKMLRVFIQDSSKTTGEGLTGLVYNSGSLVAYYIREGDASPTSITLATMTVGTWATGGFKEISSANMPGMYEIGIPDAVIATGANSIVVMLKGATNMSPVPIEIQLTDFDPNDAVTEIWAKAMSDLSAVPAANASALDAINFIFELLRNKRTQTGSTETLMKDDGSTPLATSATSDNSTTAVIGEWS